MTWTMQLEPYLSNNNSNLNGLIHETAVWTDPWRTPQERKVLAPGDKVSLEVQEIGPESQAPLLEPARRLDSEEQLLEIWNEIRT